MAMGRFDLTDDQWKARFDEAVKPFAISLCRACKYHNAIADELPETEHAAHCGGMDDAASPDPQRIEEWREQSIKRRAQHEDCPGFAPKVLRNCDACFHFRFGGCQHPHITDSADALEGLPPKAQAIFTFIGQMRTWRRDAAGMPPVGCVGWERKIEEKA